MNIQMTPKRLQLLHEAVPSAKVMALLVNPPIPPLPKLITEAFSVAPTLGVDLHVLHASTERDLDAVFANLIQSRAGGLVIAAEPLFSSLMSSSRSRLSVTLYLRSLAGATSLLPEGY